MDCEFLETKLDDINFEATIKNDLKTKNTTFLNLHFNQKFPMNFWKSNHRIDITNSLSFEKFLKSRYQVVLNHFYVALRKHLCG